MRLIDADAFKRVLDSGGGESTDIKINKSMPLGEIVDIVIHAYRKCLFAELDNQPTAYDVDKVVKKLTAESKRWRESGKAYEDEKELGVADGFKRAIEIVKSGGIS